MTLPGFFEVKDEEGRAGAYVALEAVLNDPKLRGEVVASLLATAERLEAQAQTARDIAHAIVAIAAKGK